MVGMCLLAILIIINITIIISIATILINVIFPPQVLRGAL